MYHAVRRFLLILLLCGGSTRFAAAIESPIADAAMNGDRSAVRGKSLLHGLSVRFGPRFRTALAAGQVDLASFVAEQMAGGLAACSLPLGLRSIQPLEQPMADGLDHPLVFRGGLIDRRIFLRWQFLQVSVLTVTLQLHTYLTSYQREIFGHFLPGLWVF